MGKHKNWSEDEDKLILSMAEDSSLSINEVADQMGLHRNQIMRRMKKLGVSKSKEVWTTEKKDFLSKNVAKFGYAYCAAKLEVSEESVRMMSRRLDLPSPNPRSNYWTTEEDEVLTECRNRGEPFAKIASRLGRTQEAARYRHKVLRGVL